MCQGPGGSGFEKKETDWQDFVMSQRDPLALTGQCVSSVFLSVTEHKQGENDNNEPV